jgi:hypothetical protein
MIGWFIINIQSDLFWHRCLERQAFSTPRMYALSPSKSIKGSNYGEFLKDKNVLLCTRLYFLWELNLHAVSLRVELACSFIESWTCMQFFWELNLHAVSRAPDKLRICIFYAMKTSKNACIIRSECTHYAYIKFNSQRNYMQVQLSMKLHAGLTQIQLSATHNMIRI